MSDPNLYATIEQLRRRIQRLESQETDAALALPVTPANGGTGISSYTIGDLLYASGATTLSKLIDAATGNALISGGAGVAPSWGKIGLTTHISGILGLANGGVNADLSGTGGAGRVLKQSSSGAAITVATLVAGDLPVATTAAVGGIIVGNDLAIASSTLNANKGTSFPGSPATNDLYFRTDKGLWCYYDGTRWLTLDTFSHASGAAFFSSSVANANLGLWRLRADYAPYFMYLTAVTRTATTNNGSNYWTVTIEGRDTTFASGSTIGSFNTSADTVNVYTSHDGFTVSTANPTNRAHLNINLTVGAGAPGAFLMDFTAFYKLIVT